MIFHGTYKVTRDSFCVELYIFDIPDPKNLQNEKKIIAFASLEQEIRTKGHAHGHVTLTYKVTRNSCCLELYIFYISDPKNLQNKKKIITLDSCVIRIRGKKCHF